MGVGVNSYNGGGQIHTVGDYGPIPAGVWTQRTVQVTAPAGTAEVYAQIGMETENGGAAAGDILYIDDVVFKQANNPITIKAGSFIRAAPL